MPRTTVVLPADVLARLRHESRRRGTSVSEIVREAIEKHVEKPVAGRPLSFFAIGEGGPDDASERVDEFVAQAVDQRPSRDA